MKWRAWRQEWPVPHHFTSWGRREGVRRRKVGWKRVVSGVWHTLRCVHSFPRCLAGFLTFLLLSTSPMPQVVEHLRYILEIQPEKLEPIVTKLPQYYQTGQSFRNTKTLFEVYAVYAVCFLTRLHLV